MKVKIGELKTHLSKLVKEVHTSGEPLEVCLREETVAYLVAPDKKQTGSISSELEQRIRECGLTLNQKGKEKTTMRGPSKNGRPPAPVNSVVEMRKEKNW